MASAPQSTIQLPPLPISNATPPNPVAAAPPPVESPPPPPPPDSSPPPSPPDSPPPSTAPPPSPPESPPPTPPASPPPLPPESPPPTTSPQPSSPSTIASPPPKTSQSPPAPPPSLPAGGGSRLPPPSSFDSPPPPQASEPTPSAVFFPPTRNDSPPAPPSTESQDSPPTPSSTESQDSNPKPPSTESQDSPPKPPSTESQDSPPKPPSTESQDSPPSTPSTSNPSPIDSSSSPPSPPTSTITPSSPSISSDNPSTSKTSSNTNPSLDTVGPASSSASHGSSLKAGVAVGVIAAVLVAGLMMAFVYVQRRRRKHNRYNTVYMAPSPFASSPASGNYGSSHPYNYPGPHSGPHSGSHSGGNFAYSSPESGVISHSKTWFTYNDLSTATNSFSSENILGSGGFGCVYKGCLQDGREVAVKMLKDNSGQGEREFKSEVEVISRVHHRHLVSLVGYCINEYQRLLVFEFVPNDTLHHHLHGANRPLMGWSLRVKVAAGSARGIAYLHEDCHPRIIHRDIKSANILLDNHFEAKVADFGLAKLAQELELNTHVSTRVMGTFGYMAPEYASSGKLTEKSDVFSFGVVLLELITGRKPIDETRPLGDESLVEWARPLMSEALENQEFDKLADSRLEGNYDRGEMFRMIEAAAACVRHSASKRPKMSQVIRALDMMNELSDLSNGMKPGQSEIYDTREQSAQIRMFQRMAFGSQDLSVDYTNSGSSWRSGRSGQV